MLAALNQYAFVISLRRTKRLVVAPAMATRFICCLAFFPTSRLKQQRPRLRVSSANTRFLQGIQLADECKAGVIASYLVA